MNSPAYSQPDQFFSYNACVAHLRERLAAPLPGTAAQLTMAPAYRPHANMATIDGKLCREAAVLALFFPQESVPTILLTARHPDLKNHAGQISFPGGRREPDESLPDTALREAKEEVGLPPASVELLGTLTPLYIPPSNFCVYPFVGITHESPRLQPQDAEVDAILRIPFPQLLAPETLRRELWTLHGREVEVPFFSVGSYRIWGATAMMLAELLALFE